MSGLLAAIYSNSDRLKRHVKGLLSDPVGSVQQTAGRATDDLREVQALQSQAFANQKRPLQVTDPRAFSLLADKYMTAVTNFAPVGMTSKAKDALYPRAEALETARKNGVTMLGLPENNTPMDRARAMGFDTESFRGTSADEKIAKLSKGAMGDAHYSGLIKGVGNDYAGDQAGANVMPLLVRGRLASNKEMTDIVNDVGWAKLSSELTNRGFTGVADTQFELAAAVKNPAAVRSRFAAFDPARINENDLLGRADPYLLGILGAGAGGAAYLNREKK